MLALGRVVGVGVRLSVRARATGWASAQGSGSGWASALAEGWGYLRRVAGFIEIALQIASCGEIEDLLGGLHDPLISSRELRRPESRVLEINAHRLGAEDLFVPVGKSAHRAP